jgi:hypothetical protein
MIKIRTHGPAGISDFCYIMYETPFESHGASGGRRRNKGSVIQKPDDEVINDINLLHPIHSMH